jgi:hypothetical protein
MEKNRIQIDGVWYVKEEQTQTKEIEIDPCWFEGCVVENGEVSFEATRIFKEENVPYSDSVNIEFTDKRSGNRKDWKVDNWDNNSWMVGIMENNADSMKELPDIGKDNILFLQEFLKQLKDKDWFLL